MENVFFFVLTFYLLILLHICYYWLKENQIFIYDFDLLSHLRLEFNAVPSQGNSASKCYKHNTETQVTLAKHFFIMTSISYQIQTPSTDVAKVLSNGGFTFHSRMNETECLLLWEKKKVSNKLVISLTRWTKCSMVYKLDYDTYGLAPIL